MTTGGAARWRAIVLVARILCAPLWCWAHRQCAVTNSGSRVGYTLFKMSKSKNRSGPNIHGTKTMPTMPRRRLVSTVARSMSSVSDRGGSSEGRSYSYSDDVELFRKWVTHSDMSFHSFDDTTATATAVDAASIRMALLAWYRQNRRKLPWRGDAPPYDGSTAGINSSDNNNNNIKNKQTAKGKYFQSNKITNFFEPSTKKPNNTNGKSAVVDNVPSLSPSLAASSLTRPIPVSAYGVWVSEIMLQQTRVEAVIPYWIRWMTSFPTVQDLAAASEEQVNAHWAGLGFYRRARMLHQGAKMINNSSDYHGELPSTVEGLLKITGIGPYTASAIASIASDVCVPVVDGNVCRVLSRLTGIANHIKAPALKDKQGWDLASQLVQAGDASTGTSSSTSTSTSSGSRSTSSCAGEVNQALMELGATYCAPSGTGIDPRDPLKNYYYSTRLAKGYWEMLQNGDPILSELASMAEKQAGDCPICDSNGIRVVLEELQKRIHVGMSLEDAMKEGHGIFPLDPPKTKKREEDLAVAVISNVHDDQIWWLLIRRPAHGLLAGQWEFPSVCVENRLEGQSDPPTPNASKRRQALTRHLDAIMTNGEQRWWTTKITRKPVASAPLEHIFSHIKHIMWLETISMKEDLSTIRWTSKEGREVRWMRESDMEEVGITSGVKKVLNVVQLAHEQQQQQQQNKTTTKKRKR